MSVSVGVGVGVGVISPSLGKVPVWERLALLE